MKPTVDELYPVYLDKNQLAILEDLLYEKSSILTNMAKYKAGKQDVDGARLLDSKSLQLERLAGKFAVILDDLYLAKADGSVPVFTPMAKAIKKQGKVVLYQKGEGYYAVDYSQPYDSQSLELTTLDEATKLYNTMLDNKENVNG